MLQNLFNKFLILIGLFFFLSCTGQSNKKAIGRNKEKDNYKWTKLTDNAAFPKSYNFQLLSIRDTLWAMHHAGIWFSVNGKDWIKSPLVNVLKDNAFLDYVWFKNALYSLGTFEGNVEHYTFTTSIFRTSDMKNWETLAAVSNLPKRFFYHPFVFNDKLWIIGGNDGSNDFDGANNFSDIWNSIDGVHWKKQADSLPFGKREHSQFVYFNDMIYLLNNDVWASSDGLKWEKVTDRLVKENIFGYTAVVYDNRIWLLGCNRDGIFQSQVLVSKDGIAWTTQTAPWTPRGAATATVYKGKIFMTGGKYGGLKKDGIATEFIYSNDVWTMEKKDKHYVKMRTFRNPELLQPYFDVDK
ncbi:MAG TPA: hypothetical protein VM888_15105 [Chitinophagaceae bacterium]|nr:hypothetical protein [Chitinophagaceae bacterium]